MLNVPSEPEKEKELESTEKKSCGKYLMTTREEIK
jgi:hypothetical protein